MAKTFTKFGYDPAGQLVYRNTGKLAPTSYTVKGNTVYSKGRKIGTVSKNPTAAQKAKIRRSFTARQKRKGREIARAYREHGPKQGKPRAPKRKAELPPDLPDHPRDTDFPEPEQTDKDALAEFVLQEVKAAAKAIRGANWMIEFINQMDKDIIWEMYVNGDYVLELYFEYYSGAAEYSKKPEIARWFIQQYKAYESSVVS